MSIVVGSDPSRRTEHFSVRFWISDDFPKPKIGSLRQLGANWEYKTEISTREQK